MSVFQGMETSLNANWRGRGSQSFRNWGRKNGPLSEPEVLRWKDVLNQENYKSRGKGVEGKNGDRGVWVKSGRQKKYLRAKT